MLRNKYFVSLISLLFIGVLIFNINFFSKRWRTLYSKTSVSTPLINVKEISHDTKHIFPVRKDNTRWRRDPFMHNVAEHKVERPSSNNKKAIDVKIALQGIMMAKGERSYALVNGQVVEKGMSLDGILIEDIFNDGILIRTGNHKKVIKLDGGDNE